MKRKWFGTDGIRAEFGREPMTAEFVYRCGGAAALFFGEAQKNPRVVVGRDTRASGPVLEAALCQGLEEAGARVCKVGVLPTAAISLLTLQQQAAAGIMISASHNEYTDNGIKFFGPDGYKLADAVELELEKRIETVPLPRSLTAPEAAQYESTPEYREVYRLALQKSLPAGFSLNGLQVFVDAAHGAAWRSTPEILQSLGASVTSIASAPDGTNINRHCGSLHPAMLQSRMPLQCGAVGLCHDGDADRLVMLDENGEPLDGDELLAMAGLHALQTGLLPERTLVATVMSNLGLDEALQAAGGRVVRTAVGDRYVLEAMRAGGYGIGGEQSGHMLFLQYLPTGDGLLSALQILRVMVETGRPLRELRHGMRKYPQLLKNLKVREKKPLEQLELLQQTVRAVEQEMNGRGRVLIRYSGTENKVRVLLEKAVPEGLEEQMGLIVQALEMELGGVA